MIRHPLLLLLALLFAACERPFVEVARPQIRVVAPADLAEVQTRDHVTVRVEATSFRPVTRVEVNGAEMAPVQGVASQWEATVPLRSGLNALDFTAFDAANVPGTTTLHALRMELRPATNGPVLPEHRGGHTATLLLDGTLLVTGGSPGLGQSASNAAFVLRPDGTAFERLETRLTAARTGHAATLLPDGRVLFTGGVSEEGAKGISALVETPELFDPATRTFSPVGVRGAPIRHVMHTALLRTDGGRNLVLELLGGEGDIRYGSTPRYGTRDDLRAFHFVRDSLIALAPGASGGIGRLVEPLAGHTALSTTRPAPGGDARYVVAGALFTDRGITSSGLSILFEGGRIGLNEAATPRTPRARHAGTWLSEGFFMLFGGWQGAPNVLPRDAEVYAGAVDRYFLLAPGVVGGDRFGHTATNLGNARILLVGGFTPGGSATAATAFFNFVPFE